MNNVEDVMSKLADEGKTIEENEVLFCPVCSERLMYMEPDGNTLYCNKCEKYFKNESGTVGGEITNPYPNENVMY